MKLKPSSPYHQSSNAYAIFSSRLNKVGERWLPSVSNNDASVKQNDNDEHKPIPLAALAASSKVLHALTTASAPKCGETTLKSTVLTSAVFFYKTPLRVTTGIAKMGVNIFYAALSTIATLTQKVPSPTQHIETHSLYGRGRLLKILVSAVRFCPGPPRFRAQPFSVGRFVFGKRQSVRDSHQFYVCR